MNTDKIIKKIELNKELLSKVELDKEYFERQSIYCKDLIEVYKMRILKLESLKKFNNKILEYKDLAGNWYEYTDDLQENPYFDPENIREQASIKGREEFLIR